MKKSRIAYMCALGMLVSVCLTGCGDGSEEDLLTVQGAASVNTKPLLSEAERAIYDYELKYNTRTFEMQDYYALAELYAETGQIRKQRDMLEQGYRLYGDEAALEKLAGIFVNLEEEEKAIAEDAALMLQNLELPEYFDESVNIIGNSAWIRTMMPKLTEGSRNYFLKKEDRVVLTITVGYTTEGVPYSKVWYADDRDKMTSLQYEGGLLKVLQTGMSEGNYDGAFELWTMDENTGNILWEQGSFAKGIFVGDYTRSIYVGSGATDLFSLWSGREGMEYLVYQGHFDEQGRTTLEQPGTEQLAAMLADNGFEACVVYAYDQSGDNYLFWGLEETSESVARVFDLSFSGLQQIPAFEHYEVVAKEADVSQGSSEDGQENPLQIRIFDGEIQYFDGYQWISAGSTAQLSKADPFYAYAQKKEQMENALWGGQGACGTDENNDAEGAGNGEDGNNGGNGLGMGEIISTPEPTNTPAPTKKPAATAKPKPAVTPKPVVTPAPTPVPTPEPEDDDDDDDDDTSAPAPVVPDSGDSGSGGGDPAPSEPDDGGGGDPAPSEPDDGGGSAPSEPDEGGSDGDVDVEWTPDDL